MRCTKTSSVVITAALLVGGCRTSNDALTPTEIGDALLTVTDMGTDWQETQRDVFDQREVENPVLDAGVFCPAAEVDVAELESLAGQSGADVEFQKKDGSAAVRLQAWSSADAADFAEVIVGAAAACAGSEWSDQFGTSNTFENVDGPEIGDSSVHWSVATLPPSDSDDKFASVGRVSVVSKGEMVIVMQWGTFGTSVSDLDFDVTTWAEKVGQAYQLLDDAT